MKINRTVLLFIGLVVGVVLLISLPTLAQLEPAIRRKLMAMGLLPSSEIRFIREAPMGDPLQIATSSITLSVQKALARQIEVQAS